MTLRSAPSVLIYIYGVTKWNLCRQGRRDPRFYINAPSYPFNMCFFEKLFGLLHIIAFLHSLLRWVIEVSAFINAAFSTRIVASPSSPQHTQKHDKRCNSIYIISMIPVFSMQAYSFFSVGTYFFTSSGCHLIFRLPH